MLGCECVEWYWYCLGGSCVVKWIIEINLGLLLFCYKG